MNKHIPICNEYVKAEDRTTLLLTRSWLPYRLTRARDALKKIYSSAWNKDNGIMVVTPDHTPIPCHEWVHGAYKDYLDRLPLIPTQHMEVPVPTILVTNRNAIKISGTPSLQYLYTAHKGICQICLHKKPIKEMTIEHIMPRSKGGPHTLENVTLTCSPCNSMKGDSYPYLDAKGRALKGTHKTHPSGTIPVLRDEWSIYLAGRDVVNQKS